MKNDVAIEKLWLEYSNVAINHESNTIDQDFNNWKKGTDISEVRKWFNIHYSKGLIDGLVSNDEVEMEERVKIYEKKIELLQNICNWFKYKLKVHNNGFIEYTACKDKHIGGTSSRFTAMNIDDALMQWKATIIDSKNEGRVKIIELLYVLNERGLNPGEAEQWKDILESLDIEVRICSVCRKLMYEGFCIEGGDKYYCDRDCRNTEMTEEEFKELFNDGDGDTYWTEWL